jgi:hypothetical protein
MLPFMNEDEYFDSAAQGLRPYPDFEWFTIDSKGHIAFLSSAGFAAIPLVVFRSKPQYFYCANYLENLPVRCKISEHSPCAHVESWFEAAQRGLFVYDYSSKTGEYSSYVEGKPYRLIASPHLPLTLLELPREIQEWLQLIQFKRLDFTQTQELFPESEFEAVNV